MEIVVNRLTTNAHDGHVNSSCVEMKEIW